MKIPRILLCLCAVASSALGADKGVQDAGEQQWKRTPYLAVPYLPQAPKIDGAVDDAEWSLAAAAGPFKVNPDGAPDGLERKLWLGYDDANIYIAFRLERPPSAVSPAMPEKVERNEGGSGGVVSDAVEALFAPQLQFKKSYSFWVYGNGAYGDALCKPGKDRGWNAEWTRAAHPTATGWEGEMSVPFAAFGLSGPPAPEEWWGFDFVDNRQTPSALLAFWSYRGGSWHSFQNFGRIRFAREAAVHYQRAGDLGGEQSGVEFEARAAEAFTPLRLSVEVLRRKAGEEGGPKSYFDNIESGVSQDAQAEFTKDASLADMIKFAETFYEPIPEAPKLEQTLAAPGPFGIRAKLPYGEYLARYRVENGTGGILAAGANVFRNEPPLALHIEPYWLYSQVIDISVDLRKTPLKGPAKLTLNLLPEKDGTPLANLALDVDPSQATARGTLAVDGVPPGRYRLEAHLTDAGGQELSRNEEPLKRPEFPVWYKNDWGNKIVVPAPWTPLEADANGRVKVWGREYDLSRVFPVTAKSQGLDILPLPVQLRSDKPLPWVVEKVELKEKSPAAATYEVAMSADGLRLAGTVRAEFDGLLWYDLVLKPITEPIELSSLVLDMPVAGEIAQLMGRHQFLQDPVLGANLPKPDLNGASGPLQSAKMPFTPYLWVGNEKAGLGFVAEAPVDWNITRPGAVLETQPAQGSEPARLLAHIIQASTILEKPLRLQFGLQATPIRQAPKDRSVLNIYQRNGVFDDEPTFVELARRGCKVVVFYYDWRGDSKTEMGGTPERPPAPEQQEKLKRAVALAHKHGLKVIMFTGWGVNAKSPNWKQFSYELGRYPITNGGWGTFNATAGQNGAYIDFMAWGHADLAREYGVDGVLWDSAANLSEDQNLRTGNAWVDAQGRVRPKFPVLGTRELYRRIYNIYKGEVATDGVIYNHGGSMWPINVYADMLNRGEGRPMTAKTLRESWVPFEEFRTDYSGEPFGILYSGEINDWAKLPMRVSTHLAVTLLHGTYAKEIGLGKNFRTYDYESRPLPALWETFGWLPMDGTETRDYYYQHEGQQAVKAAPATLLSSAFVSGDRKRAIVVVSNLDLEPVTAAVQLDLPALGLETGRGFKLIDGVTGEAIPAEGNTVKLEIERERYRVIRVALE